MASRFPSEENVQLRTRKGHDMKWSCDKHAEPIAFHCKKHKINICHRCATKDHGQKPCVLEDIEDVILEMRRKLEDTQPKIAPVKKRLKILRSKLESNETSASNHLKSVNDNVNATYDGKVNSVNEKERDKIRLINEEADEEIRIINEKRDKLIEACKEEAEEQRQTLKDSAAKYFDIAVEHTLSFLNFPAHITKSAEPYMIQHYHSKALEELESSNGCSFESMNVPFFCVCPKSNMDPIVFTFNDLFV